MMIYGLWFLNADSWILISRFGFLDSDLWILGLGELGSAGRENRWGEHGGTWRGGRQCQPFKLLYQIPLGKLS